jgi:peptide/nickel transport system substrate-binding protein
MEYRVSILFKQAVIATLLFVAGSAAALSPPSAEELMISGNSPGISGGNLIVAMRTEPKTLNPLTSNDASSREVIAQTTADLIHINRKSQQPEPALATSWKVSADKLHYTLQLRKGIRFSDGSPFDADDVVFSFKVYLDEHIDAPQRDSLIISGKPISVRKTGPYTVVFDLASPYASAARLFDSVAILPSHLLRQSYVQGKLIHAWGLSTPPQEMAGLGPFFLKNYVPGQRLTLARNPYYWKTDQKGNRLPYLNEMTFVIAGSEDAEVIRFEAGEADVLDRISSQNYSVLQKESAARHLQLYDLGPGLEYNFLLFNLNAMVPTQSSDVSRKQAWFKEVKFRQAISLAIDRSTMNRLVYLGRGTPLWTHVTPGNLLWFDPAIPRPPRSLERSRQLLKEAGFSWRGNGKLVDAHGEPISFSIVASSSSSQRIQMATMLQQDLDDIGMEVQIVPLEFRGMLDRVFKTHNYDVAVMALGGGDIDPNSQMNVLLSSGDDHLWNLGQSQPATPWEAEIDRLMKSQVSAVVMSDRKRLYDRVQEIEQQNEPLVFLLSPNVLVGATQRLGNFNPAVLDSHTLWNSEQLYFRSLQMVSK